MHEPSWGLSEPPFRSPDRVRGYFNSPTHEEAVARLHFLVENGTSLGILTGPQGGGRSTVLAVVADQLRKSATPVCIANLVGQDVPDFLWSLAAGLGTNPGVAEDRFVLWRRITDRLEQSALQGATTVLLLDDADRAAEDVLLQVLRLLKTCRNRLTIILSADPSNVAYLGGDLLQLSPLRIQLDPWDEGDVAEFLRSGLAKAENAEPWFEDSAAVRLHELTDGIPRRVRQLAELAVVAAAGAGRNRIDADTIDSVVDELGDPHGRPEVRISA